MSIQLSFQCDESWDKMPKANNGKFCGKCSKNIYDLTNKTESEIHQLYKKNNGKLCGKIKHQQLNNSIYAQQKMKLAKFCFALFLVFGGHLFQSEIKAQTSIKDSTTITTIDNIEYYTIKGVILDEGTKEPLPFVSVYYEVNNITHGSVTDFDGKFTLKIVTETIVSDSIDLTISSLGYQKTKITGIKLSKEVNTTLNLELKYDTQIEVLGYIISCPPIIDRDPLSHGRTIITGDELRRSP